MLSKMGLSCHPATVALKLKELGKDHDKQLLAWKKMWNLLMRSTEAQKY